MSDKVNNLCKELGSAVFQRDQMLERVKQFNARIDEIERELVMLERMSRNIEVTDSNPETKTK